MTDPTWILFNAKQYTSSACAALFKFSWKVRALLNTRSSSLSPKHWLNVKAWLRSVQPTSHDHHHFCRICSAAAACCYTQQHSKDEHACCYFFLSYRLIVGFSAKNGCTYSHPIFYLAHKVSSKHIFLRWLKVFSLATCLVTPEKIALYAPRYYVLCKKQCKEEEFCTASEPSVYDHFGYIT